MFDFPLDKAKFGVNTPPHILIEIEDTEAELEELKWELAGLETTGQTESPSVLVKSSQQSLASSTHPLSLKNILTGIIITVMGGVILAFILQDGIFAPIPPPTPTPTSIPDTPAISAKLDDTPTATHTPTDIPPDEPTATHTPTSTPVPEVRHCPNPTFFQDSWDIRLDLNLKLGCPTNASTSDFIYQTFERGTLAWQKSPAPSTIYAFFDDGRWEKQPDPGGPPEPSCAEAEKTGMGPIFGFGTLWCKIWKSSLGQPTSGEIDARINQIQNFENGTILTIGPAGGFILYSDSSWEHF